MPRGRQATPRRLKAEGEVWHKHVGPHRRHGHFVLCMRCRRCFSTAGMRRHLRTCLGMRKCAICELPFPCTSRICPWRFPAPPTVPPDFVPYFRRPRGGTLPPDLVPLERRALRWLAKILEKTPWCDR